MRQLINRRSLGIIACLGSVGLAAPAAALGKTHYKTVHTSKTLTYAGSCTFSDAAAIDNAGLTFSPGLTVLSQATTASLIANGSCGSDQSGHLTGTLTGRASCAGTQETLTGTGTLVLSISDAAMPVKLSLSIAYPNGTLTISGTTSGSATGDAMFLGPANLGDAVGCFQHGGMTTGDFNTTVTTTSPIVSVVPVTRRVKVVTKSKPKSKRTGKPKRRS